MKRSTTYDNLALLINKGIVSSIVKGKVSYYEAANPEKIVQLLDEKKNRIKAIIPKLQALKEEASEKTGVTFYEGKKGVITVLNDILDQKKELWFYGSRKMGLVALENYPENFIKKRAEAGIELIAVLAEEDKGDPTYKNKKIYKLSNLRFLKKLNKIESNVFIYGDRVAFISSGINLVGIIIRNKEIVAQQRNIFRQLWKQAKR